MDQLINIIGTYYLSGFIILNILYMNFRMNDSVTQIMQDMYSESNAVAISNLLEYDIYKVGYGVTAGSKVLQSDSTAFKFAGDLNADGKIDTVLYYVSSISALSGTPNPRDFIIYRKLNSATAEKVAFSTSLKFTYSDATGVPMSYSLFSTQTNRDNIKYIGTYVRSEGSDSLSYAYSPVEWQIKIKPKNI